MAPIFPPEGYADAVRTANLLTVFPYVDVRAFGAFGDGVSDDTAAIQAAINSIQGLYPALPILYFPPGIYKTRSLTYSQSDVYFVGAGSKQSQLQHADGDANPLIHNTATTAGSPPPAFPFGGFCGLSFLGGSQTTALIYVDGSLDNNMKWIDLQFMGQTANSTMDAISIKDYLNWGIQKVRWDGIGGWAINVRGNSLVFNAGHLLVEDFSYDNSTGTTAWGNGLFFMDAASGTPLSSYKGSILFTAGRVEINRPLNGAFPSRGIVRILQDLTAWTNSFGNPLIQLSFKHMSVDANGADNSVIQGRDMKFVSVSAGEVALSFDDFSVFGITEPTGNDAGNQVWTLPIRWNSTWRYFAAKTPGHTGSVGTATCENHFGMSHFWALSDSGAAIVGPIKRGDVVWYRDALNDGGHVGRVFARKAVQATNGYHDASGPTLTSTGSITSGTSTLTLSGTLQSSVVEGANLTVVGAGAASADLTGVVLSVDYQNNIVTLDSTASTTVSGASVKLTTAIFFVVNMVQLATAAPITGTYAKGDTVINTSPSANSVYGWTCVTAGTPGTWAAVPTGDASGKLATTQLSGVLAASATLTYTSIAAQTAQEQTVTVTGATAGKSVMASPAATLGNANLSWCAWVSATNTVSVRVSNPTAGAITPAAVAWNVTVIQ